MVTMAQSQSRKLGLHAHSHGSHAFTHTLTELYINTVTFTTTLCEAPAQLLQNLESNFYFEGTWGRRSKPEYPEKTPVTMAQSAANWGNTHTHMDRMHSLTHFHQHSYNNCVRSASSVNIIWNQIFILKVPEGGGENRSTRKKPRQPAR